MKQKADLSAILGRFEGDLAILSKFISAFEELIGKTQSRISRTKFTDSARDEILALAAFMKAAFRKKISVKKSLQIKSPAAVKLLMNAVHSIKQTSLLSEMSLIYVTAQIEGYLKDLLKEAFVAKPESLKSKRQVSYEEILEQESLLALTRHLAQREVDDLGRRSIDDFSDYFQQKFNLPLSAYPKWPIIREAAYRRNLLVHNSGITNTIYCKALKHQKIGEHLSTDLNYIKRLVKIVGAFSRYVHRNLTKKLKL